MMLGPMQRISKVEKERKKVKWKNSLLSAVVSTLVCTLQKEKEDTRKLFTALGFKPTQRLLEKEIPEYQIIIKG